MTLDSKVPNKISITVNKKNAFNKAEQSQKTLLSNVQ